MDAFSVLSGGTNLKKRKIEELKDNEDKKSDIIKNNEFHTESLLFPYSDEEIKRFRRLFRIRVTGNDIPPPIMTFSAMSEQLLFPNFIRRNIKKCAFEAPTPVQMQAIPISASGRDLFVCSPTGSGKTLAFVIPILLDLKKHSDKGFRALIITPVNGLSKQIYREIKRFTDGKKFKICHLRRSTISNVVKSKYDIVISTPQMALKAISEKNLNYENVRHLIFDEGDRLFDHEFIEQTNKLITYFSSNVRKSLFSATIPSSVENSLNTIMNHPIRLIVGKKDTTTNTIDQRLVHVGSEEGKLIALRQLIHEGGFQPPVLIFVQSVERANELYNELKFEGFNIDVMHGERTQAQKDSLIHRFRQGEIFVLICTDIMSRGMDFKGVTLVINYDFPVSIQSYIHRVGRTGRAGRFGKAITYFSTSDTKYLRSIVHVMQRSGSEVPEWMINLLPKIPKKVKKKLKRVPPQRTPISTFSIHNKKNISINN
ncbi:hypothetical protein PNEG_01280 [Pneumocystis murina B123]|uniref:RNA helicase n=1 Tax=Pneumocystis murina (strain B123) TaxID=1069680 RepID=M7P9M9_PNEMU|nr:hypothetical protein PNEG_01280 [Pneumocystis murina B123]EMR10575.1 hypothetical protein PNEG_01280 [Pneumocystis murina B123]